VIAKTRKSTLAAATVVALTLTGLGVSAIAATSAKNTAATGYVVCISKANGDMKLRTKSTCPAGFTTKVFGAKGPAGLTGAQGIQGIQGIQGAAGVAGAQGLKGDVGEMGMPGEPGEQGLQGEQGVQGVAGLDGSAATVYTGYSAGQDRPLAIWSDDPLDYRIMVTDSVVPQGRYLVTATSSFRYGTDPVECWIKLDSSPIQNEGIYRITDTTGGAPVTSQAVIDVPSGGNTISYHCVNISGTTSQMTHFDAFISALKIGDINP
jgi:hypothetical protein